MTILAFDHMIVGVADTPGVAASFGALGFDVLHRPDAGISETDIRLICFDDLSYLEIFAFRDPVAPSQHRWKPLMARGDGWLDYSVHCDNVDREAARLRAHGVPVSAPRSAGKALVDGRRWEVRVMEAGDGIGSPVMPFFIGDLAPRQIRVPRLAGAPVQPGGKGGGIVGVTLVTGDLGARRPSLAATFGDGRAVVNRFGGTGRAELFEFAGRWVEVIEADTNGSLAGQHLKVMGEGVFEVAIGRKGGTGPGDGQLLDVAMTGGARLRVDG